MRRSGCGAPRALVAIFALAAAASAATTTSSASSARLAAAATTDDGAAPSHSYVYERGYARFVVDDDEGDKSTRNSNNNNNKRSKRRGGGGDKQEDKRRLEFVRVAPSPPSSSSSPPSPSSPSLSSSAPWSPPAEAVAWCEYADSSLTPSGTGHLHVATSGDFADFDQMRAAGFVEGFATARRVADHLLNTRDYFLDPVRGLNASLDGGPLAWVEEQDRWLRAQVARKLRESSPSPAPEGGRGRGGRRRREEEEGRRGQQSYRELEGDDDDDDDDDGMPIEYWRAAAGTLEQLDGLAEGYRAAFEASSSSFSSPSSGSDGGDSRSDGAASSSSSSPPPLPDLSYEDLRFLNANGELYDVLEHFKNKEEGGAGGAGAGGEVEAKGGAQQQLSGTGRVRAALSSSSFAGGAKAGAETEAQRDERLYRALALSGRCSSLVAVTPDLSDLLIGHATWDSFSQMTKIFKQFSFSLNDVSPPSSSSSSSSSASSSSSSSSSSFGGGRGSGGKNGGESQRLAMSSFPGELFSDDDFYLTPSLAVVSTTNHILNASLFDWLPARGRLLSWQRVRVALLLASDGEAWARLFANRNSGTYNNQYDVVTLSRFSPGRELREGLLWVVEQVRPRGGGGGGEKWAVERKRERKKRKDAPLVVAVALVVLFRLTTARFPSRFPSFSPLKKKKNETYTNRSRAWSWPRTRPRPSSEGAGRPTRCRSSPRSSGPRGSRALSSRAS